MQSIVFVLLFLLPLFSFSARSQGQSSSAASSANTTYQANDAAYAAEPFVIERLESVYSFAADGTGFRDRSAAIRIQSEAAVRTFGVVSIPFAGNSEQVQFLYARVRHPDGTTVETQVSDALEMPEPVTREAPFYSDLKEKQLPVRSLRVGDTLEWKARITRTKAEAPGRFWGQESFSENSVVLAESVELRVPVNSYVNVWSPATKPTESVAGNEHVYHWTTAQLKPTAGKEAEAANEAKKKEVWTADQELDAEQGKLPSVAWTNFKSWEEVGGWYHGLEVDRTVPSAEIKAKVAELITGKATPEDKAHVLYSYVATQIRYIGVAFGVGRYQPHTAAEILANQYGDCKDKHTLLASMLSAAGIDSDAVLIGAGIRFNPPVPSPAVFNHLITRAAISGKPVWLDATAEIAPYEMLYSSIRDKQALVVPATGAAHVERSPAKPPFATFQTMNAVGSLDKTGTSHSRLTLVLRGDGELIVRSAFRQVSPSQYNELVQQILHGIGYAGTTSNAEVTRPEDTSEPFKMSFDYEREKAGDWDNYKIIPQLVPVSLPRFQDKDPLVRILNLGFPGIETSTSAMKLPEGWGADLPEAVHTKCPYATYDLTYRFENGTVYAERRVEVLQRKVPVNDLKTYKKWANDTGLGDENFIQLTRVSASTLNSSNNSVKNHLASSSSEDGLPVVTPEAAQRFYLKASELYNQKKFDELKRVLDQEKAVNPEESNLWTMYGLHALMHGKVSEAEEDFQNELKFHPDSYRVYPVLVELQKKYGKRQDALNTARKWVAAENTNPAATIELINMLLEDGNASDAMNAGESVLHHISQNDRRSDAFQLAFGRAQIGSGRKEEGTATLQALLKNSTDESIHNAATLALVDADVDLPVAEQSARESLSQLVDESKDSTLDEDTKKLDEQRKLIAAAWDRLGWILSREGKSEEARSYLRASWLAEENMKTTNHLYQLESGHGKTQKLDDLYRIPLGPANGQNGVAEYRLLLRDKKVIQIEPTGTKKIPGAEKLVAKAKLEAFFPNKSDATFVRLAYLNCHSNICELVFQCTSGSE